MKLFSLPLLLGATCAPLVAHAHPDHGSVLDELYHLLADVDPVWGGVIAGLALILGALWIGHARQ